MYKKILLAVSLLILIGAIAYIALMMGVANLWLSAPQGESTAVNVPEQAAFEPKGYLLLNLQKDGEEQMSLYSYQIDTGELKNIPSGYLLPHESRDNSVAVFTGISEQNGEEVPAIFKLDSAGVAEVYASSTYPRLLNAPKLSLSGTQYLFTTLPNADTLTHDEHFTPSNWRLYRGSMAGGEPQFVANSSGGVFSPDDSKILYLAADGFHTYDIVTEADTLVPQLVTPFPLTYYMADISSDGKRIVISSSPENEVKVGNILSWDPLQIEWTHSLPILAYWPQFSPDGNYLAVMNFDWIEDDRGNQRISVIDLRSGDINTLQGLEEYTAGDVFISDWTSK